LYRPRRKVDAGDRCPALAELSDICLTLVNSDRSDANCHVALVYSAQNANEADVHSGDASEADVNDGDVNEADACEGDAREAD
jgi:hypothetical protein